jgi:hypothetical protein
MFHHCIHCASCQMTLSELKEHYEEYHPGYGLSYYSWSTNSNNPDNWIKNIKFKINMCLNTSGSETEYESCDEPQSNKDTSITFNIKKINLLFDEI